jgi:hypothetical protein
MRMRKDMETDMNTCMCITILHVFNTVIRDDERCVLSNNFIFATCIKGRASLPRLNCHVNIESNCRHILIRR